jgi:hypothetical protein
MIPPADSPRYVKRELPIVLLQCGHWFQPKAEAPLSVDGYAPFYCPRCNAGLPYFAHHFLAALDEIDDTPMIITMWETQ